MAGPESKVVNTAPEKGDVPSKQELLGIIEKDEDNDVLSESSGDDPGDAGDAGTSGLSPREQEATSQGWQTEAEWVKSGKDAKTWRPAETWLERGDFFKTISTLRAEVTKSNNLVAAAFEQGRKLEADKLAGEIADLKAERKEARREGDFEKADTLDDKIDELKEKVDAKAPPKPTGTITPPPEFGLFKQRNAWYDKDAALHYAADGIGYEYMRQNPGAKPADLYWHVEQTMQQRFPELKGKTASLPPSPTGGGVTGKGGNAAGAAGLVGVEKGMSDIEREIMRTLVKTGVFKNKEEYLKEYAAAPRKYR